MRHFVKLLRPPHRQLRAWCVLPMLALTLFVATADWWHAHAHEDAGAADHECSVMHWKGGELGFAEAALPVPLPHLAPTISVTPLPTQAPISADFLPSPARGPPLV